jgi:hypothetical protein
MNPKPAEGLEDTVCERNANKVAQLSEQMQIVLPVIHFLKQYLEQAKMA